MNGTHTFATLELSAAAYDEIREKLEKAGYQHAFLEEGAIDMHGLGVTRAAEVPCTESPDVSQLAMAYSEALNDANGLCRSAYAIACRAGIQTNWPAFRDRMHESLVRQAQVMSGVPSIPDDQMARVTATPKTFRIHALVAASLCDDEGCDHAGTPHECIDPEAKFRQVNSLLEERGMNYGRDALEGVVVGWDLAHEVNGADPNVFILERAARAADGTVSLSRVSIRDWPVWLQDFLRPFPSTEQDAASL